ncbi:MAG: hypothetical protein JKY33_04875 [Bacteroidia bacterium]|nr:hypothetical protein [Bacteroidia bacterium]
MTALRIIEITWLVLAFITFGLGVYKSITVGFMEARTYWMFICTFLAAGMYAFKRMQRLNYIKRNQEEESGS